jgi:hypothetical protein
MIILAKIGGGHAGCEVMRRPRHTQSELDLSRTCIRLRDPGKLSRRQTQAKGILGFRVIEFARCQW